MKYIHGRTFPRFHPLVGGILLAAFLFGFLLVFDLLVLNEALADVWAGALTTAVVIGAFQTISSRRRGGGPRSEDPTRGHAGISECSDRRRPESSAACPCRSRRLSPLR